MAGWCVLLSDRCMYPSMYMWRLVGARDKGLAGVAAVVRSTAKWHGTFHMATLPLSNHFDN